MKLFEQFMVCLLVAFAAGTLAMSDCDSDNCTVTETRCNLNRAEICGSDHNWHVNLDCEEVGGSTQDWVCCWMPEGDGIPAGHGCLPGLECPAVTDADADAEDDAGEEAEAAEAD